MTFIEPKERWFWAVLTCLAIGIPALFKAIAPQPYWDVEVISTYQEGDHQYLTASFQKGDCERVDVVFLGLLLGLQTKLPWEALDGFVDNEDRTEGFHVIQGRMFTDGVDYEAFEVRTRHICDGRRVDRVFLHIDG